MYSFDISACLFGGYMCLFCCKELVNTLSFEQVRYRKERTNYTDEPCIVSQ